MKRALVLSGGGCKGAFEVGAIEYLLKNEGLDFRIFTGTSVGALNAAFLGQAGNRQELLSIAKELKELWLGLKGNHSIYKTSRLGVFKLIFSNSLYKPIGLQNLIRSKINLQRLFDPATIIKISAVALETGELFYADSRNKELQEDFLLYVLASASMPLFFPAVPIAGKHWYDGGLRDITPLEAAFKEHPDEIVVIITNPLGSRFEAVLPQVKPGGAIRAILRTIEILLSEIATNDLQLVQAINKYWWKYTAKKPVPIRIIAPQSPLAGEHALDFNPNSIRENMHRGWEAAKNPRLLLANNPRSPIPSFAGAGKG